MWPDLDSFGRERGLMGFSSGKDIRALWQLGWLRAELVETSQNLDLPGVALVGQDESGSNLYADERVLLPRDTGWEDAIAELSPLASEVKLYFHPFRYYVLYHIDRILRLNISPLQVLHSVKHYPELTRKHVQLFQQLSAQSAFLENIHIWNKISELAIVTEPCFYQRLFGTLSYSSTVGLDAQKKRIADHWLDVEKWYQEMRLETVLHYQQGLCIAAESLDPNKDIHIVLRLTRGESRVQQIKGLDCCVLDGKR